MIAKWLAGRMVGLTTTTRMLSEQMSESNAISDEEEDKTYDSE